MEYGYITRIDVLVFHFYGLFFRLLSVQRAQKSVYKIPGERYSRMYGPSE